MYKLFDSLINEPRYYISIISIIICLILFFLNNLYYPSGLEWKNMGKIKPGQIENDTQTDDLSYKNYERKELVNKKLSLALSNNKTYGKITKIPKDQFDEFKLTESLYNKYIQSNINNEGDYFVPIERSPKMIIGFSVLFFSVLFFLIYFLAYRTNSKNIDHKGYRKDIFDKSMTGGGKVDTDFIKPFKSLYIFIFRILIGIMIPILIITLILYSYQNFYNTHGIIIFILSFFFVIIFLAVIFILFKSTIENFCKITNEDLEDGSSPISVSQRLTNFLKNSLCIIFNLVFALPCILLILVEKFKQELKITKPIIFLLLILEVIIIVFIYLIPQIYKKIVTNNSKELLDNKPAKLDTATSLSYTSVQKKNGINIYNPTNIIKLGNFSINLSKFGYGKLSPLDNPHEYSINFSLYIKPTNTSDGNSINGEVNIIDFCKQPQIKYNVKTQELIFKTLKVLPDNLNSETMKEIYRTNYFKLQRFNNITINYYDNNIDIFINGYLRMSSVEIDFYNLGKNSEIKIGEELGIRGTLKDLYYYNKKQSSNTVNFLSKLIDIQ